jgi:rhs family protein
VDPWGLSPISFEEYEQYRQERIKNKGAIMAARWLQVAAVAVVVASVFWGGPLIAGLVYGAVAGALEGAAGALEKTKNGQIDLGNVLVEVALGGAKGAVTGVVAKVFTHAQVFAKIPVNGFTENMASKMASKAGSSKFVPSVIQKPAQKAASFISARRDSVSKTSWKTKDPAPWVRMQNISGKYAPDLAGESLSAGVGAVWDYTRKAENFNAGEAAKVFAWSSITGLAKSGITKGVKVGYSDKVASKTNDSITKIKDSYQSKIKPGEKAPLKMKLQEKWDITKEFVPGVTKQAVVNEVTSRGVNATFGLMDKYVQRDALQKSARNQTPISERRANLMMAKDFTDAILGTPKDTLKSGAGSFKSQRDKLKKSTETTVENTTVAPAETAEGK